MPRTTKRQKAEDIGPQVLEIRTGTGTNIQQRHKETASKITKIIDNETSEIDSNNEFFTSERLLRHTHISTTRVKPLEPVQNSRVGEYEEDLGRIKSQQFLNLAKLGSECNDASERSNEYIKHFKKMIQEQERHVIGNIDNQNVQLSACDLEFNKSFDTVYTAVRCSKASSQATSTLSSLTLGKPSDKLYHKTSSLITSATTLRQIFQSSTDALASQNKALFHDGKWAVERIDEMRHILAIGMQVGERKVERILGVIQGEGVMIDEIMKISDILYEKDLEVTAEVSWANVAKKQGKGVKRFVRNLPQI